MPALRAIRLLQSVEAGITSGSALNVYLTDNGRLGEFANLLSTRGQTRRMATNQLTMDAIVLSAKAIDLVFTMALSNNDTAAAAVAASAVAMTTVTGNNNSLVNVLANPVSWALFNTSAYYETNVWDIIVSFAGLTKSNNTSLPAMMRNSIDVSTIAASPSAMSALMASPATFEYSQSSSIATGLYTDSTVAMNAIAGGSAAILAIVAASVELMADIVSRPSAFAIIANNAASVKAIAANDTGWNTFRAGAEFATYLKEIITAVAGLDGTHATVDAIIADAAALTAVVGNAKAVQALASSNAAMTTLANSPNIGIVLGSAIAMGVIGPNTTAMGSFLGVSGAWPGLFASSVAKGYIVASTALVNIVAANSALITYLGTIAVNNVSATGIPDGNATALQPFVASPALPAKLLTLKAKEVGIAATYSNYNFGGATATGSQAGATLSLSGTGPGGQPAHIAGYAGMTWNFQGIGVTAATLPIITYVDMT
jgi:hypothetical protein